MNDRNDSLRSICAEALEIKGAMDRAAFLAGRCGMDAALGRESLRGGRSVGGQPAPVSSRY